MLKRLRIDPYLIALAATVGLAALLPARGTGAVITEIVTNAAIFLLFFLYGARLAPQAVLTGFAHWRLQGAILLTTFVVFPILGMGLQALIGGHLPAPLVTGLVFTCLLPSTVQSSIAFTSIARGNVPAALCAASASNLAGVILTPLLVGLVLHTQGGFNLKAFEDIALQLLLPFGLGQAARPLIGAFLGRHKVLTSYVDRGSILFVVYGAFSAGVVAGIWHQVDLAGLASVIGLDVALLAIVLVATTLASRAIGFNKADEIATVFCGSKKSMASGIPMANILFPAQSVGLVVLPLMLFHQIQLFACAFLAQRYGARAEVTEATLAKAVS
ncbi:bile acid:sodium symporter [Lichenihabitans sp. Uapishka_5]|uniref:bile acid:sodium symporter family protein n=1 Tax=Lichenihabitans sp. Uapishka_5 TaxID=3037302 RepID=UPI0029E80A2B|nr:bile acid:sodium symporter family protein [Lichenihabitans sp. Uapishka_5]MDX7951701.1 bile acid:sodium symporter [Lichenihabitans sp. Uapishka_5]